LADLLPSGRSPDKEFLDFIRSPETIRERCQRLLTLGREGRLAHFKVQDDRLKSIADRVITVTKKTYPTFDIPFHSRWRHFEAGGRDRATQLDGLLKGTSREDQARARFELTITSVLLDAGAGPTWQYREVDSGKAYARSEGLAVASYDMFVAGVFSSQPKNRLMADGAGLAQFSVDKLALGFQVTTSNPLVGLEGRCGLIRSLAAALSAQPQVFTRQGVTRLGHLFDHLAAQAKNQVLPCRAILAAVLETLGSIWPGRLTYGGVNLGDVWHHSALGAEGSLKALVPFHKLSQWLTYSLIEPFEVAGIKIVGVDQLTGLPEYRNGGLLLDGGVLEAKHRDVTEKRWAPGDEVIVEWRALTVGLLDEIGRAVQNALGKSSDELPLAKVLQGGTWTAGREIAAEKRPGGAPPITIESDGTVF